MKAREDSVDRIQKGGSVDGQLSLFELAADPVVEEPAKITIVTAPAAKQTTKPPKAPKVPKVKVPKTPKPPKVKAYAAPKPPARAKSPARPNVNESDDEPQSRSQMTPEDYADFARTLSCEDLLRPEYNSKGWTPAKAEGVEPGSPWCNPCEYPRTVDEIPVDRYDDDMSDENTLPSGSNMAKIRSTIEGKIRMLNCRLERDGEKYEEIVATGVSSFGNYAFSTDLPGTAWRAALSLLYNQLRHGKAELAVLQSVIARIDEQQENDCFYQIAA
jgi:hypothetical protein